MKVKIQLDTEVEGDDAVKRTMFADEAFHTIYTIREKLRDALNRCDLEEADPRQANTHYFNAINEAKLKY